MEWTAGVRTQDGWSGRCLLFPHSEIPEGLSRVTLQPSKQHACGGREWGGGGGGQPKLTEDRQWATAAQHQGYNENMSPTDDLIKTLL